MGSGAATRLAGGAFLLRLLAGGALSALAQDGAPARIRVPDFAEVVLPPDDVTTPPSPYGRLTSRRWALGTSFVRESLAPVPNPNPAPEPQPSRAHPFDVAVNGDGTKVYVGLAGSELEPGDTVVVYGVVEERVLRRITLRPAGVDGPAGSSPYRLTIHPAGRHLLVTNRFSNFATVIDTVTDRVVSEVDLDFYCQGVVFDAAGKTAWVANRYLDQVFPVDVEVEGAEFRGTMRVRGGLDEARFRGTDGAEGVHAVLRRSCGTTGCHDALRGGFIAGEDARASFRSTLAHVVPGRADESRLLRAVVSEAHGGYADRLPRFQGHADGAIVFSDPAMDADYRTLAGWIDAAQDGPGIPVGNPRSKPKVLALSGDGRLLFVGNTGTQDISIIDTARGREVGAIYLQNVVNDLVIHRSPTTGRELLLVTTEGIGFGVGRERDPYGGESWDEENPAAQYSVWRDPATGKVLPRDEQTVLGPFDAVDGTSEIKFRDIQNDLLVVDVGALEIPEAAPAAGLRHILLANRYESHRAWTRYTSDTAESTYGDIKGDIPPDLMRVVGALPERMVIVGDRVFVTMQGSNQVQELRVDSAAADPSDYLVPIAVHATGLQPTGIAAGPAGTPAAGLLFVTDVLGGTLTILDSAARTSRAVVVDPSVVALPVPATNAERGEIMAHTAVFSSDGDTACFHCHYLDTGDGRPWGVSQVLGQEFLSADDAAGHLVIGGTMILPQMRGLFPIQPFFIEGVISAFEPRSMIMEHCPADDFTLPTPQGDFTHIEGHTVLSGTSDVQSRMDAATNMDSTLEERRDEMFRRRSMELFGKAFVLRDFQRFVGEWQIHEPRLLPNPFDAINESVRRGKLLFELPQVGCISCHPAPAFAKKDFADRPQQSFAPVVTFTPRDGSFNLIGMNRLDYINGFRRDLEPWDKGRVEEGQGMLTTFPLRGIWDRPPVFLHHGMARSLREVVAAPGHVALRTLPYEPRLGGVPERPGRREVGLNMTYVFTTPEPRVKMHIEANARLGFDTHGGTSQLRSRDVDDLVNFMNSIQ